MRRKKPDSLASQMKRHSKKLVKEETNINPQDLVPMGSTLLNLAMSDSIEGGAKKGTMINIIGASHGGKTILALTSFAEANMKESFDDYTFIYDDVERANAFNMPYLFGRRTAKRIQVPRPEKDDKFSTTVQHFQANIKHHVKKETPFIYVLDSFDALDALEDQKKVDEMVDAIEKDKKTAGTYGMAKAKAGSSILRNTTSALANSESVLFIVSQVRDNVDPISFEKETRSGGRALKFYASHEMWMHSVKQIKKKDTIIGNRVRVRIKKNKLTGKNREVSFDVYYDYGIDDIGSCIDYLIEQGRWSGGGSAKINHNGDFEFENCTKSKMIKLIEGTKYYQQLKELVAEEWKAFEDSLKLGRKSKYN